MDSILRHIYDDCINIEDFIMELTKETFVDSILHINAVSMSIISIGELVKELPTDFRNTHTELPWDKMAGMRDIVAHHYKKLNKDSVWLTASIKIPEVKNFIEDYYRKQSELIR